MVFITHCSKRTAPELRRWLLAVVLLCFGFVAHADSATPEPLTLKFERSDEAILLSAQLKFDLPASVEEALLKGIPVYFAVHADLLRERWYWTNKKVAAVQQHIRLSYLPLTRRWRLNTTFGESTDSAQGLALNRNFETLAEALNSVRRISRWKIADASEIDASGKYLVDFRFQLDMAQLPRPLQIGTLGQSDWLISLNSVQPLTLESSK